MNSGEKNALHHLTLRYISTWNSILYLIVKEVLGSNSPGFRCIFR